ncbi:MAG: M28 family peptidase, partial [Verrucomicrobia bacterium]|nr:M28 family peptidase [Verrucomicrobiota bacterium]
MRRRWSAIVVTALIAIAAWAAATGCGPQSPRPDDGAVAPYHPRNPELFQGSNALAEVRDFIAITPRASGTEGAKRAAIHVAERLSSFGIEPVIDEFIDPTPSGPMTFRNVTARLPGHKPSLIVIAAHYDTKSGISPAFVGANDSGSGIGVLLELARVCSADKAGH